MDDDQEVSQSRLPLTCHHVSLLQSSFEPQDGSVLGLAHNMSAWYTWSKLLDVIIPL